MPKLTPVFVGRRKDRGGWWVAWRDRHHRACEPGCRIKNKDGLHRVLAGVKKKDAENMAEWVRQRLHPWNAPERGIEWAHFVGLYMLSIASRSRAHRTLAERVLTSFTLRMAPVGSRTVLPSHIDRYLAELKVVRRVRVDGDVAEGAESASEVERAKHWRYLHALFGFGVERGYCSTNPVLSSARPRVDEQIVRAPRWDDVVGLLEAVPRVACNDSQGLYLLVLLAVVTGLRASDLLGLRLADLEHGTAQSGGAGLWWGRNRKGRKVKVCGIPAAVEALVNRRIAELPDGTERLFFWPSFPHAAWDRLRCAAKAGGLRFQALRRAAGVLAAATAVQRAGQRQLQHSGRAVFERFYEDREQEALAVASSLSLGALPPMPGFSLGALDRFGRRRVVRADVILGGPASSGQD